MLLGHLILVVAVDELEVELDALVQELLLLFDELS